MAKRWVVLSFVASALVLSGCSGSKAAPETASAAPRIEAAKPAVAARPDFVASGPIVVENQVDIQAQREGMMSRIVVDAGDMVRKGQLLGTLDDRQISADRDAAQARVKSIAADVKNWEGLVKVHESDVRRAEEMRKADLNTQEQVEHQRYKLVAAEFEVERERANLKNAEAALVSLNLELEKARIVAPFEGVVARRYVRAGQKVAVGDRLFWVTALKPLRVRFTLPENFIGKVQRGTLVSVSAASAEDQKHAAKVIQVSPVVDPASGTIEVLAEIVGAPAGLRPGMTALVRLPESR